MRPAQERASFLRPGEGGGCRPGADAIPLLAVESHSTSRGRRLPARRHGRPGGPGSGLFADRRVIAYLWDSTAPKDTAQSASSVPLVHIFAIVCRSGAGETNRWIDENHNLDSDYQRAFGKAPAPREGPAHPDQLAAHGHNCGELLRRRCFPQYSSIDDPGHWRDGFHRQPLARPVEHVGRAGSLPDPQETRPPQTARGRRAGARGPGERRGSGGRAERSRPRDPPGGCHQGARCGRLLRRERSCAPKSWPARWPEAPPGWCTSVRWPPPGPAPTAFL